MYQKQQSKSVIRTFNRSGLSPYYVDIAADWQ
jgi:hypothetical protein